LAVNTALEVEQAMKVHWKKDFEETKYPIGIVFTLTGEMKKFTPRMKDVKMMEFPRNLEYSIRTYYPDIGNTADPVPYIEHSRYTSKKLFSSLGNKTFKLTENTQYFTRFSLITTNY